MDQNSNLDCKCFCYQKKPEHFQSIKLSIFTEKPDNKNVVRKNDKLIPICKSMSPNEKKNQSTFLMISGIFDHSASVRVSLLSVSRGGVTHDLSLFVAKGL